jgi:hypothetical protein
LTARRIAEAQFDLNRVRNRRRLLITQFLLNPYFVPPAHPQTTALGCKNIFKGHN